MKDMLLTLLYFNLFIRARTLKCRSVIAMASILEQTNTLNMRARV